MVIKQAELDIVCGITSKLPDTGMPEVAFAGKSNVGKSSLINGLMNRKAYARVSQQPGKTQTINYEIVCGLARRVPRVYKENGKICEIWNDLEET